MGSITKSTFQQKSGVTSSFTSKAGVTSSMAQKSGVSSSMKEKWFPGIDQLITEDGEDLYMENGEVLLYEDNASSFAQQSGVTSSFVQVNSVT